MSLHAREYWHRLLRFSGSPLGFIKGKYMHLDGNEDVTVSVDFVEADNADEQGAAAADVVVSAKRQ